MSPTPKIVKMQVVTLKRNNWHCVNGKKESLVKEHARHLPIRPTLVDTGTTILTKVGVKVTFVNVYITGVTREARKTGTLKVT